MLAAALGALELGLPGLHLAIGERSLSPTRCRQSLPPEVQAYEAETAFNAPMCSVGRRGDDCAERLRSKSPNRGSDGRVERG